MDADPLPPEEMLYMLRQVATALDYAHRQEVVHRDLKPSNIMIDLEGNAFVADFGIARVTDAAKDLTGTGNAIGTPGYMAPEQARGKDEVDGRADVYSMGVIAYELLAGRGPYDRESAVEELMAHLQEPVPDITEYNPDLSPEVNEVVQKALAKDREQRYASSGEFINALADALHKQAAGSPSQLRSLTQSFAAEQIAALDAGSKQIQTPSDVQRQMTALYMDVSDFAELLYESEETDTVQRQIDRLWHAFESIADDHGGILESRTGEAGLMIWGRAEASESDPEQAIRAALKMKESVITQAEKRWGETEEEPPFKAAITTGPVLLTREKSGDTTASGATITLANRLKESAPPGEVMISHDTYTQVRGVFTVVQLPPVRMRGRADALEVYEVMQARPRAFRQQVRGIEGVETKMIGREPELKILQDALTLTIEDSETQVVTVVGEAGVGKSRLLYEFSNWVDLVEQTLWFFEARATQPSMLQPYSLTRDLFSFRFQIMDNDPLPVVHEKFEKGIEEFMNGTGREAAHMIGQLVGFDFSDSPIVKPRLEDPESFHHEALDRLGEFFLTASDTNPVLIQVEDIHWGDERSLDLLNSLARENTDIPLFIIYMARPGLYDRRPSWGEGQEFHARIALNPLSRLDSRRLVRELLKKVDKVPPELRDLIIDRAEGNPYYMEELVRTLIDDGVIVKGEKQWSVQIDRLDRVRVPQTLVGVLQSRLDSFPPGQRSLLQRASVVGRIFWESAVAYLSTAEGVTAGTVSSMLNDLRRREMVFKREETAFEGTAEYGFRHAILRDVVYETIVPRQRREHHKAVAEWITEAGSDRLSEYYTLIAEHYERAEAVNEAADFLGRAADGAQAHGGLPEAVSLLEKALGMLGDQGDASLRMRLQLLLGKIFAEMGRYEEGKAQLEPALETAQELEDRGAETVALAELGRIAGVWQDDRQAGQRYLDEALTIAREIEDKTTILFVSRQLGNMANAAGDLDEAEKHLKESIEIAREQGDRLNIATAQNSLGLTYGLRGDFNAARELYEETAAIAERMGAIGIRAMVLGNIVHTWAQEGEYKRALRESELVMQLSEETGSDYLAAGHHTTIGVAQAGLGELESARFHFNEALRYSRELGSTAGNLVVLAYYARLRALEGDTEEALAWLGMVYAHPGLDAYGRFEADLVLGQLRGELTDEEIEDGMKRGEELDLDKLIAELIGEPEPSSS
jgi:predicted ATPase/class 3 adenylate cyclase